MLNVAVGYQYPLKNADEQLKLAIWAKGFPIVGYDPAVWRRDKCGSAMMYADHGITDSDYGWEIDHIFPVASGGQTVLGNLQPLNWLNNRRKGNQYPWTCSN